MNNITIIGKLVGEIKSSETTQGTPVAKFSVMSSRKIREEWQREFYRVACYGEVARRVTEYLAAKDRIVVIGSLQQDVWEDDNGKEQRNTYIYAREVAVPVGHIGVILDGDAAEGESYDGESDT